MSKRTLHHNKAGKAHDRVCHVAYTLNNSQPVISTIIGDEPLFYMDCEESFEEDDGLYMSDISELSDLEMCDLIKTELADLHRGNHMPDFMVQYEVPEALKGFSANITSFTNITAAEYNTEDFVRTLENSRFGKALSDFAQEQSVEISVSPYTQNASFCPRSRKITVSKNIDFEDKILLLARELRRFWQSEHVKGIDALAYTPEHAIFFGRIQHADLCTAMIRVAWELQLSGVKTVWERLMASSMADMAEAFASEAYNDFRTLNDGDAAAACFETWFMSERPRVSDKAIIRYMLADTRDYISSADQLQKEVTAATISAFGEMPYGKNYLAKYAATILGDVLFHEVRDRSNANFLWFIKFERTFRETEQHLHSEGSSNGDDILSSSPSDKNKPVESFDHEGTTAQIVSFEHYERRNSVSQTFNKTRNRGSASVTVFPDRDKP